MLAETLTEAARRFGDRPALVAPAGWSLSYDELDRFAAEAAVGLAGRGVAEGDVVALTLPPGPEHFVAYLAAAKLGAITAAVNAKLTPPERAAVLAVADPALVVATEDLAPRRGTAALGAAPPVVVVEPAASSAGVLAPLRRPGTPPPLAPDPDRPIAIVFTSGTTGLPKGAVFCGRQMAFITECDVGPEWGGGGRSLAGSALAHLGPMTKLAGNLRRGSTQYLTTAFKASAVLQRIAELKIAAVGGVPTQVALMLRDPHFDDYDLASLKAIVMGGGPATPALVREARRRFDVPVSVRYSCTEAGIGTGTGFADPPEDAEETVGRAQLGVTVRVVDAGGEPVPPGEIGEVTLASPAVMAGYWRSPDQSAGAFCADGAVRTGDLGWIDERGRLHLAGRSRERYVRGGYNVHPMEVEAVLAEHPGVRAVVVVPRNDPVMGEVGVAVVVPADGADAPTLEGLRTFAGGHLARYKLPDEVLLVDDLPLTAGDKVDRGALRARIGADPDGPATGGG
jgi:acyl-CoA synthetase (AMP-forming)/AMP-acid ligase II